MAYDGMQKRMDEFFLRTGGLGETIYGRESLSFRDNFVDAVLHPMIEGNDQVIGEQLKRISLQSLDYCIQILQVRLFVFGGAEDADHSDKVIASEGVQRKKALELLIKLEKERNEAKKEAESILDKLLSEEVLPYQEIQILNSVEQSNPILTNTLKAEVECRIAVGENSQERDERALITLRIIIARIKLKESQENFSRQANEFNQSQVKIAEENLNDLLAILS